MAKKFVAKFDASIIIIIFIYHTRTEHKIQKLNSVNESMEGYQRSYSSLNWLPILIKRNYLTWIVIIIIITLFNFRDTQSTCTDCSCTSTGQHGPVAALTIGLRGSSPSPQFLIQPLQNFCVK